MSMFYSHFCAQATSKGNEGKVKYETTFVTQASQGLNPGARDVWATALIVRL